MNPQIPVNTVNPAINPRDIYGAELTGGTDPNAGPTYLTPEALITYCQSRLNDIDSQVETRMQEQQNSINDQSYVEEIQSALSHYAGGANDSKSVDDLVNSINDAIGKLEKADPNCAALPSLKQLLSDVQGGVQKTRDGMATVANAVKNGHSPINPAPSDVVYDESLSSDQIKGYTTEFSQVTASMNSASEINMINIQSLMSQRQTAVELATNMLQTLDDTESKIVGNVGH